MTPPAILLTFAWDAASVRTSVYMLFSQVLPVLLAITASIDIICLTLLYGKYDIMSVIPPLESYWGSTIPSLNDWVTRDTLGLWTRLTVSVTVT